MRFLRQSIDEYVCLMGFLSRLPIPSFLWPKHAVDQASALALAPWVGATLGLLSGLFIQLLEPFLTPRPLSWCAAGFYFLLGWGLHLDGFADLADGWGSGARGEKMRAIMKDSRIGGYGAVALIFALGLWTSLLEQFPVSTWWFVLALASAYGRFSMTVTAWLGRYPWSEGLGKIFVSDFHLPHLLRALFSLSLLLFPTNPLFWIPLPGAFLVGWFFERTVNQRLGGVNGDVLGASAVAGEIISLAILTTTLR